MTPNLRDIASSLELPAEVWSTLERAGACACCAARLTGCREAAIYACDEQELKSHIITRFLLPPVDSDGPQGEAERAAVTSDLRRTKPVIIANERNGDAGIRTSTPRQGDCCTLCLGLLQYKVPVCMIPRARPSSESHGDDARSCVVTAQQQSRKKSSHKDAEETYAVQVAAATMPTATSKTGDASVGGTHVVLSEDPAVDELRDASVRSPTNSDIAATATIADTDAASCYRRARMAEAVAECAASRGYTITSFGLTVALPACLAVRDAAFIEAIGVGRDVAADPTRVVPCSSAATPTGTGSSPAVVSVKEALKLGLIEGLQPLLGVSGAVFDAESDFVIEVVAKAPEADAHAMTLLFGELAQSPPRKKPPGWPGSGRWSKKRQRREEHRNPGLTVGTVKKGLTVLDDEGKARMRRWVEELGKGQNHERARTNLLKSGESLEGTVRILGDGRDIEGVSCENEGMDVDATDVDNGLVIDKHDLRNYFGKRESSNCANSAKNSSTLSVLTASHTNGHSSGNLGVSGTSASVAARCDIVIRRLPIHFWGRYTKLSRVVPQTPWVKGFFSVQEAVSEPFEEFSGSIEGLLHGSGREDVDVRMLGNGRPFSLELVDSLRSVDEIAARLPALEKAINTAAGRKNAGGGVAVSELRVAGPGDLPSDVQRVGEGKRKHYRCVVWVSRAVGEEELKRTMCDRAELVVQQSTPVRVLHRRTLMDRPRSIFDMRVQRINDHFFVLDLTTSAGKGYPTQLWILSAFFCIRV